MAMASDDEDAALAHVDLPVGNQACLLDGIVVVEISNRVGRAIWQ